MIFAEGNLVGWQRAENVISILTGPTVDSEFTLLDVVDAVKNSSSLAECRRFLMQECEICYVSYPSRMVIVCLAVLDCEFIGLTLDSYRIYGKIFGYHKQRMSGIFCPISKYLGYFAIYPNMWHD